MQLTYKLNNHLPKFHSQVYIRGFCFNQDQYLLNLIYIDLFLIGALENFLKKILIQANFLTII